MLWATRPFSTSFKWIKAALKICVKIDLLEPGSTIRGTENHGRCRGHLKHRAENKEILNPEIISPVPYTCNVTSSSTFTQPLFRKRSPWRYFFLVTTSTPSWKEENVGCTFDVEGNTSCENRKSKHQLKKIIFHFAAGRSRRELFWLPIFMIWISIPEKYIQREIKLLDLRMPFVVRNFLVFR